MMMHPSLKTWYLIRSSLMENIPVMLLYVLESKGSSPGRQGFLMAVNAKQDMAGSIGGGIMEHKLVELAKSELRDKKLRLVRQVHNSLEPSERSGMICSGEQSILLFPCDAADLLHVSRLVEDLERNRNGLLTLSPAGLNYVPIPPDKDHVFEKKSEREWLYQEKTGYKNQLTIIGGGHCSLALSRLFSEMDFFIRVFDERPDLKTMKENEFAHEKCIVARYDEIGKLINGGDQHFVVVMTFGYRTDETAIRAMWGKRFRYMGVLGSANKMKKLFESFEKDYPGDPWLSQVHSPIGINIKSQTPAEIAVSIAAEIIREKNREK